MDKTTVLVVDDVPELARLLEITVELDGRFESVGAASTTTEAVDLAARIQPDTIVLDLSMDGDDALAALRLLRNVAPDSRVVVFTGRDDRNLREEALASGASAWLLKGDDLDALLRTLADEIAVTGTG
jgi:DNA-binding NarL/FixJ family response regulator